MYQIDFLRYDGWLVNDWMDNLGTEVFDRARYSTMQAALNLLMQRDGQLIVETGCQRGRGDIGSGCSTEIFSRFVSQYGGSLVTIDNNLEHLQIAQEIIGENNQVSFIESDSVQALKNFTDPIDLLYLDSFDYPVVELIEIYAGEKIYEDNDLYTHTRETLYKLGEAEILARHREMLNPSQQHCLQEIKAAGPCLHSKSIVLIDDANLLGGGKPRLAREWLVEHGWHTILDSFQSLWIKGV